MEQIDHFDVNKRWRIALTNGPLEVRSTGYDCEIIGVDGKFLFYIKNRLFEMLKLMK